MPSVNKVILLGNLGADPEIRATAAGEQIASLRLATTEKWKDKGTGESREATEWHRVVLYRRLAEIAADYLKKGSPVYIEGRLRTRKWQDREGKERSTTEIEGLEMQLLGSRERSATDRPAPQAGSRSATAPATAAARGDIPLSDDDIDYPF